MSSPPSPTPTCVSIIRKIKLKLRSSFAFRDSHQSSLKVNSWTEDRSEVKDILFRFNANNIFSTVTAPEKVKI